MEKNDILLNDKYILWLNRFIEEHIDFNVDDVKSLFGNISEEDKDNINRLGDFYDVISLYAANKEIFPSFYLMGNYYKVEYNKHRKFLIGKITFDGEDNYFCKKGYLCGKYINYRDIVDYHLLSNEFAGKHLTKKISK